MPFYSKILIQQKIHDVDTASSLKNKKNSRSYETYLMVQICG